MIEVLEIEEKFNSFLYKTEKFIHFSYNYSKNYDYWSEYERLLEANNRKIRDEFVIWLIVRLLYKNIFKIH